MPASDSEEQGQTFDLANLRIDRANLFRGLDADIQRQSDVPPPRRRSDRIVKIGCSGKLGDDRVHNPASKSCSDRPIALIR